MPLDTITIVPPAGTSGSSASVTRRGPRKLTSVVRRATSASKPFMEMPALLTSTSMAVPAARRCSAAAAMLAGSPTSSETGNAVTDPAGFRLRQRFGGGARGGRLRGW